MSETHKSNKDEEMRHFLKRKIRKINKRQNRLTRKDIVDLLDKPMSKAIYPEPEPRLYKNNDF